LEAYYGITLFLLLLHLYGGNGRFFILVSKIDTYYYGGVSMNVRLKELQVLFYENEIIILFPDWYQINVKKMQVIASSDIKTKHYGVAYKGPLMYILLAKEDVSLLPLNVISQPSHIEHLKPNCFLEY